MLRLMLAKQFLGESDIWRHFKNHSGARDTDLPPTLAEGRMASSRFWSRPI